MFRRTLQVFIFNDSLLSIRPDTHQKGLLANTHGQGDVEGESHLAAGETTYQKIRNLLLEQTASSSKSFVERFEKLIEMKKDIAESAADLIEALVGQLVKSGLKWPSIAVYLHDID